MHSFYIHWTGNRSDGVTYDKHDRITRETFNFDIERDRLVKEYGLDEISLVTFKDLGKVIEDDQQNSLEQPLTPEDQMATTTKAKAKKKTSKKAKK